MRQRAAGGGDDADHALRLQLRQLGRCHVVAHQDLAGHPLEVGCALVQERMDAADHVIQIVHAALEVRILHPVEHRRQAVALHTQGIVGAVTVGADQLIQALQQLGVVKQQCMQLEKFADLARQCAVQAVAQLLHFDPCRRDGGMQALQLRFHLIGGHALFGHFQGMALAHARAAKRVAACSAMSAQAQAHARPWRGGAVSVATAPTPRMLSCPRRNDARTGPPAPARPRLHLRRPAAPPRWCPGLRPATSRP